MFEQHRAECRAQGQRVECRDQHRHRHGHRELAEQLAADAWNEGHRDEHGEQDERDGEDRPGDLRHRLLAGLAHRQLGVFLHHPLDILDHDDGIVDHDADGKDEREQGDGIGRIADEQHHREGADDRHRDGKEGDEVVRHLPRNMNTTTATRMIATTRVRITSLMVAVTKTVASQNTV